MPYHHTVKLCWTSSVWMHHCNSMTYTVPYMGPLIMSPCWATFLLHCGLSTTAVLVASCKGWNPKLITNTSKPDHSLSSLRCACFFCVWKTVKIWWTWEKWRNISRSSAAPQHMESVQAHYDFKLRELIEKFLPTLLSLAEEQNVLYCSSPLCSIKTSASIFLYHSCFRPPLNSAIHSQS